MYARLVKVTLIGGALFGVMAVAVALLVSIGTSKAMADGASTKAELAQMQLAAMQPGNSLPKVFKEIGQGLGVVNPAKARVRENSTKSGSPLGKQPGDNIVDALKPRSSLPVMPAIHRLC